jgi:hypothetical protein
MSINPRYSEGATIVALGLIAILAIPSAYAAATRQAGAFREIAESIVNIVDQEPDSRYLIYEAAHRRTAMLDHYFNQFSDRVRASGTLRAMDKKGAATAQSELSKIERKMRNNDYLVFAFPHRGVSDFTYMTASLSRTYDVHITQIDRKGRGYIVYKKRADFTTSHQHSGPVL